MVVKSVIYFLLIKQSVAKLVFLQKKGRCFPRKIDKIFFLFPKYYVDLVKGGKKIYTWAPPDNTFKKGDFSLNLSQIYKSIVLI